MFNLTLPDNLGLYWRLLASYLLIVLIGCFTFYLAGEAFVPLFFERHMTGMMGMPMMEMMTPDLRDAYASATQQGMAWGMGVAALVAGVVSLFVTERIVAPLRAMQRASSRVAAGDYQERLDPRAPGEIGRLAHAFNAMASALESTERRRLDLLANVAHEFKTPLTNLRGYVTGMRDGLFAANEDTLSACVRQLVRLERLLADLSLLSSLETGDTKIDPRPTRVAALLEGAAEAFRPAFERKGVRLVVEPPPDLTVHADAERTGQVLANLVSNALRHTPAGEEVALSARVSGSEEVRLEVRDTGEGIARADLPHVFTRFYRADEARQYEAQQGSGIGLTIAKHYVERQGGRIGVESEPGGGSRFWFTLPSRAAAEVKVSAGSR